MNTHTLPIMLAAALAAFGAGCSSQPEYAASTDHNQTARGAVAGAATGAVLGGVIGHNSSKVSTEQGAAIGAVAGGLAGAAIGHEVDQREARAADTGLTVKTIPPAPVSEPQETMPPQPASNYVWIRGYYNYTGAGYQWQPGHWEVPPP